jgi:dihydroflavonol-4-reductase
MRAFVTGAGGFIGGELARQLRARGDEVVALVRQPDREQALRDLGCELVEGDLVSMPHDALVDAMRRSDAVFHSAGSYRIGIRATEHAAMYAANVVATQRTLDAATVAKVPRSVHVSTANVLGDTRGRVVDETYRRPQPPRFVSYYDETKYLAHLAAEERIAADAPILIAMPGQVYGPHDPSQFGQTIVQAMAGTLPAVTFPELGLTMVHVADVAAGILLVNERGEIGQSYALGGEIVTARELVRRAAAIGGHRAPRLTVPSLLIRAVSPLGGLIGPLMRQAPNLGEAIRAADGVTYWFSDARARRELGYEPRDVESGLRSLLS